MSTKVCFVCGKDVAALPRVRDNEGRYACRSCVREEVTSSAPAKQQSPRKTSARPPSKQPAGAPQADEAASGAADNYFSNIQQNACPKCGTVLGVGTKVCFSCGFDSATGETLTTKIVAPPKAERDPGEKSPRKFKIDSGPGVNFLIGFVPLAALFGLGFVNKEIIYVYLVVAAVLGIWTYIGSLVCAFRDEDTVWAILGIVGIVIPFVSLAMLIYGLVITQRSSLRILWLLSILASVGSGVLFASLRDQNRAAAGLPPVNATQPDAEPEPDGGN